MTSSLPSGCARRSGRSSLPARATAKFKFKWRKVLLIHLGTNQALVICPSHQSRILGAHTGLRRCYRVFFSVYRIRYRIYITIYRYYYRIRCRSRCCIRCRIRCKARNLFLRPCGSVRGFTTTLQGCGSLASRLRNTLPPHLLGIFHRDLSGERPPIAPHPDVDLEQATSCSVV